LLNDKNKIKDLRMSDSEEEIKKEDLMKLKKESSYTYWVKPNPAFPKLNTEMKPIQGDIQVKYKEII